MKINRSCNNFLITFFIILNYHAKTYAQGWCEYLNNDGHWVKSEQHSNKGSCNDADRRDNDGPAYSWQNQNPRDSLNGKCYINTPENGKTRSYQTSKQGCENHDNHGHDNSYHWHSDNYPTIYVGTHHTGYSYELKESIPSLCSGQEALKRICHLIHSYHLPEGWKVRFFTENNYQGEYYTRSDKWHSDENNFPYGMDINSIKIWYNEDVIPSTELPAREINHNIDSVNQIYFGNRNPKIECGDDGQLLTKENIDNIGKNNICEHSSKWSIYKFIGDDGIKWSFMGYGYSNCEIKPKVSDWAPPMCVMQNQPSANKAYLFSNTNFSGDAPWNGKAEVNSQGKQNHDTSIMSFLLGSDTKLKAYSEVNYQGEETIYMSSIEQVATLIRSYKLEQK